MERLIIFLIRKRLGVKKGEMFRFTNQKEYSKYFFTEDMLLKQCENGIVMPSDVGLNWLLHDKCEIKKV